MRVTRHVQERADCQRESAGLTGAMSRTEDGALYQLDGRRVGVAIGDSPENVQAQVECIAIDF